MKKTDIEKMFNEAFCLLNSETLRNRTENFLFLIENQLDYRDENNFKYKAKNSDDYIKAELIFNNIIYYNRAHSLSYEMRGRAKWGRANSNEDKTIVEKDFLLQAAIEDFSKAFDYDPNNAFALFERGILKRIGGKYSGAIEDFTKIIEINRNRSLETKCKEYIKITIELYNNEIKSNARNSNWENTPEGRFILSLTEGDLNHMDCVSETDFLNQGNLREELNDYAGAIESYTKAIDLNSRFVDAYVRRANLKTGVKAYNAAVKDYTLAIYYGDGNAGIYFNRANTKFFLKDYYGAAEDLKKAISINPDFEKAVKFLEEVEQKIASQQWEKETTRIGNQIWMRRNLDIETFRNGDTIPEAKTHEEWTEAGKNKTPAWCYYNNNSTNGKIYGKLYNWYAVKDTRGLAPEGYHIPTGSEWYDLVSFIVRGNAHKLKSRSGWDENGCGSDESEFRGLPGGYRYANGKFNYISKQAIWVSSSQERENNVFGLALTFSNPNLLQGNYSPNAGLSVRCIKD